MANAVSRLRLQPRSKRTRLGEIAKMLQAYRRLSAKGLWRPTGKKKDGKTGRSVFTERPVRFTLL